MQKITSALIVSTLLFSSISLVQAATSFTDVPPNTWFASHVEAAAEAGIVSGYTDAKGNATGKFGPIDQVTLAQALKIAVLSAGYDPKNYSEHCPTEKVSWYMPYECVSQAEEIRPFIGVLWECYESCTAQTQANAWNAPATRIQVAYMIAHAFKVAEDATELPFTDVDASATGSIEIASLARDGILTGDTDAYGKPTGRFRPNAPINRAETAKIAMMVRAKFGTPGKGRTLRNAGIDFNTTVINVDYTDAGFSPSEIRIKQGTTLNICNFSSDEMKIVSSDYLGLKQPDVASQCPQFKFMDSGTFHIQNEFNASKRVTVIVEP